METPETREPENPKEKTSTDDLIAEVKRILEENDSTISVEEIIPPRSMRSASSENTG